MTQNLVSMYQVGGVLGANAPSYVWRSTDQSLLNALQKGMFCAVIGAPQTGKSSLRVKTIQQLAEAGIVSGTIDMKEICTPGLTASEFYNSLTYSLADNLHLLDSLEEFDIWWFEDESLSSPQRFQRLIKEVVLTNSTLLKKRITIFIDHVEYLLTSPNLLEDFFNLLLNCYRYRSTQNEFKRLNFAILGGAPLTNLIKESQVRQIWEVIELGCLELSSHLSIPGEHPLIAGLKNYTNAPQILLEIVLDWTGGQPLLTQKLCQLITECGQLIDIANATQVIEHLVRSHFLENWEMQDQPKHFRVIGEKLIALPIKQKRNVLSLYQKIWLSNQAMWSGEPAPAISIMPQQNPEQIELQLLGLVVKQNNKLMISNRIYAEIFNQKFIQSLLTDINHNQYLREVELMSNISELLQQTLNHQLASINYEKTPIVWLDKVLEELQNYWANLMLVDRVHLCLMNQSKNGLWSVVKAKNKSKLLEWQIPLNDILIDKVIQTKEVLMMIPNINVEQEEHLINNYEENYGYKIYNLLAFPLVDKTSEIIGVMLLINKLNYPLNSSQDLSLKIDDRGFNLADIERLKQRLNLIIQIIEIYQFCQVVKQKISLLVDLEESFKLWSIDDFSNQTLRQKIIAEAERISHADQCLLWLFDQTQGNLWTEINNSQKLRCELGIGAVGKAAETRQSFTTYSPRNDQPEICLPILNVLGVLLGVIQLNYETNYHSKAQITKISAPELPPNLALKVFNERIGLYLQYSQNQDFLKNLATDKSNQSGLNDQEITNDRYSSQNIYNSLLMLNSAVGDPQSDSSLYKNLYNFLNFISKSLKDLLQADQVGIFLLDNDGEFWSLGIEEDEGTPIEIRYSKTHGLIGDIIAARYKTTLANNSKLPTKLVALRQQFVHTRSGYNIYNMLVFPLIDKQGKLVALIEALNKLRIPSAWPANLSDKIEHQGFTQTDEDVLTERADMILAILQGCQDFHQQIKIVKEQQALTNLLAAINSCCHVTWQPQMIIKKVVEAGKKITNADKCALWLYDHDRQDMWTEIPGTGELRCNIGVGFVGQVAKTKKAILVPFDLHTYAGATLAKKMEQNNDHKTYSLMCLPIWGPDEELIGVLNLQNKRQTSKNLAISMVSNQQIKDTWNKNYSLDLIKKTAPSLISFNDDDRRYTEIFNQQIGIILQNARQVDEIKKQIYQYLAQVKQSYFQYQK